jgi:cell division transport system permease protein
MNMKINSTGRHLREGLKSIWRNGWMSFASISAVMITLVILGVSLVIALNAQQMSHYVTSQLEIDAFMQQSATTEQGNQAASEISALPGVKSVQLVTKEEGLKQLQSEVGKEYSDLLSGFKDNPLPIKLVVKATNPEQTAQVAHEITGVHGVAKVNYGAQYLGPLFTTLNMARNIGLVFVVALLIMAMFLISNTIKITIFSRRHEIEIMKLVGATNWFIRWPFLIEGMLIGAVGALVPYAVITYGYHTLYTHLGGQFLGMSFPLVSAIGIAAKLAVVMFGIGIVIGIWGGLMSIRRFLKI